ncbi:MAG: hypothetical protein ACFFBP_18210 [Promethearchaeota archaeon]
MKLLKNRKSLALFIITSMISSFIFVFIGDINHPNLSENENQDDLSSDDEYFDTLKLSANVVSQFDSRGKVFSSGSFSSQNCYINNEQPALNIKPTIYEPNYYMSYALMNINNLEAVNYTKEIESSFTEFIQNDKNEEMYVFQKFAIQVSQYVNNVSILIRDEYQGHLDTPPDPIYTYTNQWEVAIVNCSDDEYITPNHDTTLGSLRIKHEANINLHWEDFDFKNEGLGPIYLNINKTASTKENEIEKYWFALRIRIPPNDEAQGGGIKTLSFNPDGGDSNFRGEGDIFQYGGYTYVNYTMNDVVKNNTIVGQNIDGNITSFRNIDNDRYIAQNDASNNLTIEITYELANLSHSPENENMKRPLTYGEILFLYWFNYFGFRDIWYYAHFIFLYSINFTIATNISDTDIIKNADLYAYSRTDKKWVNISNYVNLNTDNETLQYHLIRDPEEKIEFLKLLNDPFSPNSNPKNTLEFRLVYNGTNNYNVSVNKFTIEIGEYDETEGVHASEPIIVDDYYANKVNVDNGQIITPQNEVIDSLKWNENEFFKAQADTDNLSIIFELEVLNDLDSSLWDVDLFDWILVSPNPIVPKMEFIISSNTSIQNTNDISLATLEIYKGNNTSKYLSPEQNEQKWIMISETNRTYANSVESRNVTTQDEGFTWLFLNFLNDSDRRVLLRLRFETNNTGSYSGFNVTIDHFKVNIYVKYFSDISSSIGFGINSAILKPEDIQMQIFEKDVINAGNQMGSWSAYLENFEPIQRNFIFDITSIWYAIKFDVSGSYDIYKYEVDIDFIDDLDTQYMIGTQHFTVEVTDGLGNPLSDLDITFELLDADEKVLDEDSATTDSDGEATGTLEFDEVGDTFTIRVAYEEAGIYASEDIESDEFRIVDEFTLFMDNFLFLLPYILIGLAALFTFIALRHRRLIRLREFWAEEAMVLEDLLKISYIMVIHKDAGLTLYSKQISMELDSDLIGGFITAISQFRSEIKKPVDEFGISKGFEMDYHDFKIDMVDGKNIRTALILEGIPSEQLKENQNEFTNSFEAKFGSLFVDFTGDITPFKETDDLVEKFFNISLMYPLQLGSDWKFAKLNKLESALLEVAEQMQKERNHFFISSLLNYGIAGRKESKNQIISTIIGLKSRGLLVPVLFT